MSNAIAPATILRDTYMKLESFRKQLDGNIVTDSEIKQVIDFLHHESTILNRHIAHSGSLKEKTVPIDSELKKEILDLIKTIHRSPSCNQALGSQQLEFSNLLKRFEQIIQKWESKVEKIDKQSLSK